MRVLLISLSIFVLLSACGSEDAGSVTTSVPAEPEQTHLGGCILTSPIGEVPADPYQETGVVATDEYLPFTKKLTVYGITLIARDDVSDEFMGKVATAIKEIFPRDESLDLTTQEEILRNHYRYKALIPVPVGEEMDFLEEDEAAFDRITSQNTVCDIIMEGVPGQVMEVVEHILHYVTDVGLHYTFPDEWGISETSALARAMKESIDKGYYNVSQYSDIDSEEDLHRVLMQEFAYWIISTAWNLQEAYGPGEDEWTIKNRADLEAKLPEFYEVIERTVGRTMVAPSLATLAEIGPTRAEERNQ